MEECVLNTVKNIEKLKSISKDSYRLYHELEELKEQLKICEDLNIDQINDAAYEFEYEILPSFEKISRYLDAASIKYEKDIENDTAHKLACMYMKKCYQPFMNEFQKEDKCCCNNKYLTTEAMAKIFMKSITATSFYTMCCTIAKESQDEFIKAIEKEIFK